MTTTPRTRKSGEATLMILAIVMAVGVIGTILAKTVKDGTDLYPERDFPYQGKITVHTNVGHNPTW
jgi:hypothetical protein